MSLYNMVNGANPATFLVLPMLGKHPDLYPRFRDCFVFEPQFVIKDGFPLVEQRPGSRKDVICVFTRVGGGNRDSYKEAIKTLQTTPGYLFDYDDGFDSTFCTFVFSVPEEWKDDYQKITSGDIGNISLAYQKRMLETFPKLESQFKTLFKGRKKTKKKSKKS